MEDYLGLLAERAGELLAHGTPVTYPVSLAASTRIAVDRLAAESPAAVQMLTVAAYLAPETIPLDLFTMHSDCLPDLLAAAAADRVEFAELVRLLGQRGLVRVEAAGLWLHRVLAAILRTLPHCQPGPAQDLPCRVVRLLRAAAPEDRPWDNPPTWPAWRQLLPHVLAATDPDRTLEGVEQEVAWLLDRTASYLQTRGEADLARTLYERAWELRRVQLGEDHPDALESANNLAACLRDLGRYEQGRELAEDTLNRYRRVLGEDHPHTLTSANNLARGLWALGRYEQARELGEETLTRYRRVLGEDHPDTLRSATNLAACLRELGQHEQARQLSEETLTRYRRVLGDDHPDTLRSASDLAAVVATPGEHDQDYRSGE
ncbi:MAG: tetratricopeptide repeat protein [Actinomycetota bacterium]|nr:tetratricopeptide repeat protein [Actinomycetota bacterium]